MEKKRKALTKIRCDCGTILETKLSRFGKIETAAMVCPKCGYTAFSVKQAERFMKMRKIAEALGTDRKVLRVGNTLGVTFPPLVAHAGQKVRIRATDPKTFVLNFL